MNYRFLVALFAIAAPLVAGSYAPNSHYHQPAGSFNELVHAAAGGSQQVANEITANADAQPSPAEAARLSQAQHQLHALQSNPTYNSVRHSESIAESLAESNLASNIRQGNVNLVAPNVVDQDVHRSLLVPSGPNNHQVIATQPLPPIVVNQPGAPPAQVSSGPAAVVRAAPVIYKIRPSVIYQQEVINKVPTPLSLNPVYVKVYKPGRRIDAPVAPVVQQQYQHNYQHQHQHQHQYAPAHNEYGSHAAPAYAGAAPYASAAPAYAQPAAPAYAQSAAAPSYAQPAAPAYPQAGY